MNTSGIPRLDLVKDMASLGQGELEESNCGTLPPAVSPAILNSQECFCELGTEAGSGGESDEADWLGEQLTPEIYAPEFESTSWRPAQDRWSATQVARLVMLVATSVLILVSMLMQNGATESLIVVATAMSVYYFGVSNKSP